MAKIPYPFFSFHQFRRASALAVLGATVGLTPAFAETTVTICASVDQQTTITGPGFLVFDECPAMMMGKTGSLVQDPEPNPASPSVAPLCMSRLITVGRDVVLPPFAKPLVAHDTAPTTTEPSQDQSQTAPVATETAK